MEITSFSCLNQEDLYNSHNFYTLLQDSFNPSSTPISSSSSNFNGDSSKRPRTSTNPTHPNGDFQEVLASLAFLDENRSPLLQNHTISDPNCSFEQAPMLTCDPQFPNLDHSDSPSPKRRRRSPAAKSEDSTTSDTLNQAGTGGGTAGGSGHHRRLWVKDRSKAWWDRCNHPDFPEPEFRRAFRMSRATFDMICTELDSAVTKKDTMLRAAIPVRQRVAVCIWRLATGEPLRLVSKRFGLGISTCHKLVLEVCSAIKTVLMPKFLQWPETPEKTAEISAGFESISGFPGLGGAMYTTHMPIIAPKNSVAAYFNKRHTERNQKTSYSMTVQGVVNHKGIFTDVCIGWPGSMRDDQVLEKSALFQRANRGAMKNVWIAGGSGYPLLDWVMAPYTHKNLTWTQHAFNEKIGEVSGIAKEAFARMKGRWACLQKRTEVKLQDLPVVLGACCVLHNICELMNEEMDPELRFEIFDDEMVADSAAMSASTSQARDHIAHNLLHRGLAGTAFL